MSKSAATTEQRTDDAPARAATAGLLWAAAQVPGPDINAIRRAAEGPVHAALLCDAALAHRVGPLVWRALEAADRLDVLGPYVEAVRADHQVRRAQAELLLPRALHLAYEPVREAGIDALLFKGPAVARYYPEPGLRPMDDIDLLFVPSDADRAQAALEGGGWRAIGPRPGDHYDEAFLHPTVPHLPLELHRGLSSWRDLGNTLTLGALWERRQPQDVLGVPAFVIPPAEDLVALAAHAGKPFHYYTRLIWAVDLAMVIHANPVLDWDRVLGFADEVHCRTVLAVGLRMAARLGVDVPDEALVLPEGRVRRDALAPVLEEGWVTREHSESVVHGLRYAMWDHRRRKAIMLAAELGEGGALEMPGRVLRGVAGYSRRWRASRGTAVR